MKTSSTDQIQKVVTLSAPLARVWRAVSDAREFGQWFQVKLEGPFVVGEEIVGQTTFPGCEHMVFRARIESLEHERSMVMSWCPYALDPDRDYSGEPTTQVVFELEAHGEGTKLTITESGFDALPEDVRHESFLRNTEGWNAQSESVRRYLDG